MFETLTKLHKNKMIICNSHTPTLVHVSKYYFQHIRFDKCVVCVDALYVLSLCKITIISMVCIFPVLVHL